MSPVTGEEKRFDGRSGWSEFVPIPPEARNAKESLALWLLFAPQAHPLWTFHALYVLDLSGPNMEKQFPEATHELGILALHPEHQPYSVAGLEETMRGGGALAYMTPPDFVIQVSASDEQAKLLAVYGARASAHGQLVPDSDYALSWERALRDTLQHLQTGGHDK